MHLLLLWIADSDGWLKEAELELMEDQFPMADEERTRKLLAIVRNGEPKPIEQAIRMLGDESRELRSAFLDLCIALTNSDHKVAATENHILHLYTDALNLSQDLLERRYKLICGMDLEQPAQPVTPDEWQKQEKAGESPDKSETGMTYNKACALLGVQAGATSDEIERAYIKLAEHFLVQRVEAMGAAAIAVARMRSRKLKDAYKLLMGE